jgi:hypothetical protein
MSLPGVPDLNRGVLNHGVVALIPCKNREFS